MRKPYCILILVALAAFLAAGSLAQTSGTMPAAPPDTSTAQAEQPPEVQLKVDTAFAYCAFEMTGSYDQHSAAFEKLYAEAMKQGIYGGIPFGIYWNSPVDTPVEKLMWDVGFALPPGAAPQEPLRLKKWEYTTMATLRYSGEFGGEGMTGAYSRLFSWIGEHGYRPAGPMMEMFLNIPSPDEQGMLIGSVEIVVPVLKAAEPKGE